MFIKEKVKNFLPLKNLNTFYVVADFDRTITNGNSQTSWSILAHSNLVSKSYIQERQALYDYYRPIEISETIDINTKMNLIKEWYKKHISLFVKYQITEEIFEKSDTDLRIMQFRPGAKEFIEFLYKNNIPLIVISAGIGNFIESFFKHNNCYFDNVYISSNKIIFQNGIAVGVEDNIIHSFNKNEVSLPKYILEKLKDKNNVILLGDQLSDLNMVDSSQHNLVINIGFQSDDYPLETLTSNYDIVCESKDDYTTLKNLLF